MQHRKKATFKDKKLL